jgi:hypothetical protein
MYIQPFFLQKRALITVFEFLSARKGRIWVTKQNTQERRFSKLDDETPVCLDVTLCGLSRSEELIFFNFWSPCKDAEVCAATRQEAHLVYQRGLAIQHRCLQVNVLSRCCFPSQDTELTFISIKTARLVCCEHRGHRNGQINKRIANRLEYCMLLLHSVQMLLSEQDSSGYVYMGDPKQIRHFAYNTRYTCTITKTMH